MLPLLKGTVNNIEQIGIPGCLTGPIGRGDIGTIQKHLEALEKEHHALLETYKMLGLATLPIALAKGRVNLETAEEIKALLEGKKETEYPLPQEFIPGGNEYSGCFWPSNNAFISSAVSRLTRPFASAMGSVARPSIL